VGHGTDGPGLGRVTIAIVLAVGALGDEATVEVENVNS
jgi:multidrug efflux pump subunit AcrB